MITITFFLLFIPLLLVPIILFVLGKFGNKTKNFRTPKNIMIGITGYISLGLCALLYLSFSIKSSIPVLSISEMEEFKNKISSIQKYDQEYSSSFLTDDFKKKTWEFVFQGSTLPVTINDNISLNIRHHYNDNIPEGKALITYYQFPSIIEGIDISDNVPLPHIYMTRNKLFIEALSEHQINYKRINASLSILDFNNDRASTLSYLSSSFIVIETHHGTELEDLQGRIQYLR